MTSSPSWWETLVADPVAHHYDIQWLAPTDWKPVDSQSWSGSMSTAALRDLDARRREGTRLVGFGPATPVRRPIGSQVEWNLDADDTLWCALGPHYDASLWIPVEPTGEAIGDVLDGLPATQPCQADLPSEYRGFMGLRHEIAVPDAQSGTFTTLTTATMEQYLAGISYMDVGSWGSHFDDDPLRDDEPLPDADTMRRHRTGRPGRTPSLTWRTAQSRSYVTVEIHNRQIVCVSIRYKPTPASHHRVITELNAARGTEYPIDLPVDVAGALTGVNVTSPETVRMAIDGASVDETATGVRILAALASRDLASILSLREFAAHPEPSVRLALAGTAAWYGYRFLLDELAHHETDPRLRAELETLIIEGTLPDPLDPFAGDADQETT